MIRSVLLALDGSPASKVATELAIRFSTEQSRAPKRETPPVLLTGISVLDRPTIAAPQPVPPGGSGYKKERDAALVARADKRTREILDEFAMDCRQAGVDSSTVRAEGLPYEQIMRVCRHHDLLFIGKDTNFHFQTSDDTCETVRRLLRDLPRPAVVTPKEIPGGNNIIVAYDGSLAASRTLYAFVLAELNLLTNMEVHIVSVQPDKERAEALCEEAARFLKHHGIAPRQHAVCSRANPVDALHEKISELKALAVVMGAFGTRGLRTLFLGSATRQMLDECRTGLFLYH
jgi:nucleotide-binding universal stress UspA family protein